MDDVSLKVKDAVMARLDLTMDIPDEEVSAIIRDEICAIAKKTYLSLSERFAMEQRVYNAIKGLDVLEELLADENITEIMINGPDNIYIEQAGKIGKANVTFPSDEKLSDVIQHIVADSNKVVNESTPICDTRLPDGSRVNIVVPPVAVEHSVVTIRKFPKEHMTFDKLLNFGAISKELVEFIKALVIARYNIFVAGGTGSGKTSFLNAMAEFIPPDERVITIEDSAELQLTAVDNLVRLEARSANLEGRGEVPIRALLKSSLRMRPDRIIVGECRGAEALEMLQAFDTGHDGSFSTGHANSCKDMVHRLETMVLMGTEIPISAVRQQIGSAIDIMVHLGRLRDKSRKLLDIVEVDGMEDGEVLMHPLFSFVEEDEVNGRIIGSWQKVGELKNQEKLRKSGLTLENFFT